MNLYSSHDFEMDTRKNSSYKNKVFPVEDGDLLTAAVGDNSYCYDNSKHYQSVDEPRESLQFQETGG